MKLGQLDRYTALDGHLLFNLCVHDWIWILHAAGPHQDYIYRFTPHQSIGILLIHQPPKIVLEIEWKWIFQVRVRGFGFLGSSSCRGSSGAARRPMVKAGETASEWRR